MLDIKFVRNNPEIVKQNIRNKFQDEKLELVDKVLVLDKENRENAEMTYQKYLSDTASDKLEGETEEQKAE